MPEHTWTLTDVENDIQFDEFHFTSADLPTAPHIEQGHDGQTGGWSVTGRVLRGGLREGVRLIEIDNGRMKLIIVPTRGMGIWRAILDDQVLGWRSPIRGPVHPAWVPIAEPSGLGWLEGFDELVVRCGLESNGEPDFDEQGRLLYPLHGRIANRPAHHVEVSVDDSAGTITVRGIVEETCFHFQKLRLLAAVTTTLGSTSFTIHDEVENYGGTAAEMQLLYHINLGEPLLEGGARIVAPTREAEPHDLAAIANTETWDLVEPPTAGVPEQCFFLDLLSDRANQTQVMLKNAGGTSGVALRFDTRVLPCFTVWKNMVASADGYVTGLEPATNFPNKRSFETQHGRVIPLAPGATWSAQVAIDWLTTAAEVNASEEAIGKLGITTSDST
jgi:galactose mutarotase-like enzyme